MHESLFRGFYDVELPDHLRKLIGKCGVFEGVTGPKQKPIINYGLPEQQTLIVAVWSFTQLPLTLQVRLIKEWRGNYETESGTP